MFLFVCWWSISIGFYITSSVVFSMVKIGSESMEIKYFRMDYTSEHIHGNWPEKFQKFTVGLMITLTRTR
jgi:hypothetical protein